MVLKSKYSIFLFSLILLGAWLRFHLLTNQSLWFDEIYNVNFLKDFSLQSFKNLWYVENHPPLYLILLKGWGSLFGESDWALRAFSATTSILALYWVYLIAKLLTDTPTALITLLFLVVSPLGLYYSQEVRHYALWMFLSIASLYFFLQGLFYQKERYLLWALFTLLALYTHIFTLFILFCQGIVFIYALLSERKGITSLSRSFWAGCFLLILGLLPLFWWISLHLGHTAGYPKPFNVTHFGYLLFAFVMGYSYGPSVEELHTMSIRNVLADDGVAVVLAMVVTLVIFISGLLNLPKKGPLRPLLTLLFFLLILIVLSPTYSNISFNVRSTLFALPFFFLVLAIGSQHLLPFRSTFVFPLALVALMLYSDFQYFTNPKYFRDDIRSTARVIEMHPSLPVFASPMSNLDSLKHYSNLQKDNFYEYDFKNFDHVISESQIWLIWNRMWLYPEAESYRDYFGAHYWVVEEHHFPGIEIQRVEKKNVAFKQ